MNRSSKKWILQLCHSYGAPFDDVARQWKVLFDEAEYNVLTVFLTGKPNQKVSDLVGGQVEFLDYTSKDLKGLKRKQINVIRALHRKHHFQLAIAHRYKPMYIASHIKGLKVYGVAHAYGVFNNFWRKQYINRHKKDLTLYGVSNAIRDDIRASLSGFPQEKIHTFYNRVNVKKLKAGQINREKARQQLGFDKEDYVVGNVGRLHPDKDQKTLIEGFAKSLPKLGKAKLAIIGEGRLRSELEDQIKVLGLENNVFLLGRVIDAWKYFKAFDVFALTSNYEPFGMVLLEAMTAEIPIISSDVGGAPEVLGDTSALFPLGSSEKLAEVLSTKAQQNTDTLLERVENHFSDQSAIAEFKKYWTSNA